ncbi:hypothetical protein ACJRO7_010052 [Eucalyptus globulus]|uniref:Uncharacterized protein n=1 Tax=Eucalyptus globulus TaxID=34317 RepID=A0ABD3LFK6_EUCGL
MTSTTTTAAVVGARLRGRGPTVAALEARRRLGHGIWRWRREKAKGRIRTEEDGGVRAKKTEACIRKEERGGGERRKSNMISLEKMLVIVAESVL